MRLLLNLTLMEIIYGFATVIRHHHRQLQVILERYAGIAITCMSTQALNGSEPRYQHSNGEL